jgi:hypothetical protein
MYAGAKTNLEIDFFARQRYTRVRSKIVADITSMQHTIFFEHSRVKLTDSRYKRTTHIGTIYLCLSTLKVCLSGCLLDGQFVCFVVVV